MKKNFIQFVILDCIIYLLFIDISNLKNQKPEMENHLFIDATKYNHNFWRYFTNLFKNKKMESDQNPSDQTTTPKSERNTTVNAEIGNTELHNHDDELFHQNTKVDVNISVNKDSPDDNQNQNDYNDDDDDNPEFAPYDRFSFLKQKNQNTEFDQTSPKIVKAEPEPDSNSDSDQNDDQPLPYVPHRPVEKISETDFHSPTQYSHVYTKPKRDPIILTPGNNITRPRQPIPHTINDDNIETNPQTNENVTTGHQNNNDVDHTGQNETPETDNTHNPQFDVNGENGGQNQNQNEGQNEGEKKDDRKGKKKKEVIPDEDKWKCPICYDALQQPVVTQCGHVFCWPCINEWLRRSNDCPVCHGMIDSSHLIPIYGQGAPADLSSPPPPRPEYQNIRTNNFFFPNGRVLNINITPDRVGEILRPTPQMILQICAIAFLIFSFVV
ncbi:hypothetical protein TRFO_41807 [Tritrichomonas foetus]|uniref:RING-type domain-containing protein n=1 Tax=Tritrichomonas foetus TaxID=1144522 RepID=A0A1J4KZB4_9EUKA|nr:hypothetical protein TRFO_41807 [Tritrichomonas foetus]|eukprot:OHT16498.1 hypothetical protein TRFO_41807 [Tritrichomonas foetus]